MKACIVIDSNASKRLIAKGVAALPSIRRALDSGRVLVALGTTNALVAEELLGEPIDRGAYAAGFIDDRWNVNARLGECGEILLVNGQATDLPSEELLAQLRTGDVIIKGGNALDPWGTAGVLMGSATGGTVGRYLSTALARGVEIVIPISLGKSVRDSVIDISAELGIGRVDLCMGTPCGMQPLVGRVVTEIEALELLFPVEVMQVASGGVGRGAASISLLIVGKEGPVSEAFDLVSSLVGEPEPDLQGKA